MYLKLIPTTTYIVICTKCDAAYDYEQCLEKRGTRVYIKDCNQCRNHQNRNPLLKEVVSQSGIKVYPYCSLISSRRVLLNKPGFLDSCEQWQDTVSHDSTILKDVHDGSL